MRDSLSDPCPAGTTWRTLLLALSLLAGSVPAAGESVIYQELRILTPANDSAFWSGAGKVSIDVAARPCCTSRWDTPCRSTWTANRRAAARRCS